MPMNPGILQASLFASIQTQMQTIFPEALADPVAAANQIKLANAMSAGMALDIITHIQVNGTITTSVPGVTLVGNLGNPILGVGVGTGTIL